MANTDSNLNYDKNSIRPLEEPLISIITVVFNSQEFLPATIQSTIEQSYPNVEYIIIDGGSTDGTVEVIKQYESHISTWISESDRGIYDAMNKGIELARGELIGILNSGDLYAPNALQTVAQLYREHRHEYAIFTGAMTRFDSRSNLEFVQQRQAKDLHQRINLGMPINHPATFITKAVYQTMGGFNSEFKIGGDYDFIYRAYHNPIVEFVFTDRVLALMSMGGVSEKLSSVWLRATEAWKIRQGQLNIMHNTLLTLRLIILGYTKHLLIAFVGQKAVLLKQKYSFKSRRIERLP